MKKGDGILDVVIIGAGIAGLAAAKELKDNGLKKIKILEARNRPGGRIHSITFGPLDSEKKIIAEMGANWIHGKENGLYEIAESMNLLQPLVTHDEFAGIYIMENGSPADENLVSKVTRLFKQMINDVMHIGETESNYLESCSQYLKIWISDYLLKFDDTEKDNAMNIFHCILDICREDCGDELEYVSLPHSPLDHDFFDINYHIPSGYQSLFDYFLPDITENIELEAEVKAVNWTGSDAESKAPTIVQYRKHGVDHTCLTKCVISTLPLGVLKFAHKSLFKPELPQRKILAIENLGYGKVNKILLFYENPFWNTETSAFKLVWEHNTTPNLDVKRWARNISAFKTINTKPNLLIAWICGVSAEEVEEESVTDVAVICTKVIRHFLQDSTIPFPDDIKLSRWSSDPFCRGCYTYIKPGNSTRDIDVLGEPVNHNDDDPVLLFAGEATSTDRYGSTHGAMVSGIREAQRILKTFKASNTM